MATEANMIVAIVKTGEGAQSIVGIVKAESLAAGLAAFVAQYDPPLTAADYTPVDASALRFDPSNPWRTCDSATGEFTQAEDALALLKATRCEEVDARTRELIAAGFAHDGKVFSLSIQAQSYWTNMFLAREVLAAQGGFPLRANTLDDSDADDIADADEVVSFYTSAVLTVKAHLGGGTALKDAIRAAASVEEVDTIVDER